MVEDNAPLLLESTNTLKAQALGWQDEDGDSENINYQWQKNGVNIDDATSDQFVLDTHNNFVIGDRISVVATPFDGIDQGSPVISNPLSIVGDWEVAVTISENGTASLEQFIFGMKRDTINAVESGFNQDISPQLAKSNLADIDLKQNSTLGSTEIRGQSAVAEWLLVVDAEGNNVELLWDNQQIPDGKILTLYEVDETDNPLPNDSILMKNASSMQVSGIGERRYLLRYADDFRSIVNLSRGWNLCSLPLTPSAFAVKDVLSEAVVFNSVWERHNNRFQKPSYIEEFKGYWVFVAKSDTTILVDGVLTSPDQNGDVIFPLNKGWNLYGPIRPLQGPFQGIIWWWDGTRFKVAKELQPFKGYWIRSLEENAFFNLAK